MKTELQTQFFKEKGIEAFNSQGEPDIDYVDWLEDKLSSAPVSPSDEMIIKIIQEAYLKHYENTIDFKTTEMTSEIIKSIRSLFTEERKQK